MLDIVVTTDMAHVGSVRPRLVVFTTGHAIDVDTVTTVDVIHRVADRVLCERQLGGAPTNCQPAFVEQVMMATAQQRQVLGLVTTAGCTRNDVMDLDVARRSASRHGALAAIATKHMTTHDRRDVLRCLRRLAIRSDALSVTLGACDRDRADREAPTTRVLPAQLT